MSICLTKKSFEKAILDVYRGWKSFRDGFNSTIPKGNPKMKSRKKKNKTKEKKKKKKKKKKNR